MPNRFSANFYSSYLMERAEIFRLEPRGAAFSALSATIFLILVSWVFLFPGYTTNDDVGIRLFLEGRSVPNDAPSGRVYFFNYVLGGTIAQLNVIMPGHFWFDVIEQGTFCLATFVVLYVCSRLTLSWLEAAFVVTVAVLCLSVLADIQFTVIATFGTCAATIAIFVALSGSMSRPERRFLTSLASVLLLFAGLHRLDGAVLGISIALLTVCLYKLIFWRFSVTRDPIAWALTVTAATCLALAWTVHFRAYLNSPEWNEFLRFNLAWSALAEYAASRTPKQIIDAAIQTVGWTRDDYSLLFNFLFFDRQIFSIEKVERVLSQLPALTAAGWRNAIEHFIASVRALPWVPALASAVLLTCRSIRAVAHAIVSFSVVALVVVTISSLTKPLPLRVFWPVAVGTLVCVWIVGRLDNANHRPARKLPIAAALICLSVSAILIKTTVNGSRQAQLAYAEVTSELSRFPRDKTLAVIGSSLPYEVIERPFRDAFLQNEMRYVGLGSTLRAPQYEKFISRSGSRNLGAWLCTDEVVIASSNASLDAFKRYMANHLDREVEFDVSFKTPFLTGYSCVEKR